MNKLYLLISLIFILSACESTGRTAMQQQTLLQLINAGNAPVVVDVRSGNEFKAGHVPGAIHVPFWAALTTDSLDNVEKHQPLVLYCEHGPRAGFAKLALRLSGFENISYLAGHMSAWRKAALPIEN